MKKFYLAIASLLLSYAAQAADLAAQTLPVKAPAIAPVLCSAGNCSGAYATFGLDWNAALSSTLTGNNPNNGIGMNIGAGYQLWQGALIAGVEGTIGYEGGTAGSTGTLTGTAFVKLGYNFFPVSQTSTPAPAQNPFAGFVPATLLQNSTPAVIGGLCYAHNVAKGCIGAEVDSVLAAQWSSAVQLYNAPSQSKQPDETVARLMIQYHFKP